MSTWIHLSDISIAVERISAVVLDDNEVAVFALGDQEPFRLKDEQAIEFDYKFCLATGRVLTLGKQASKESKQQWWEE